MRRKRIAWKKWNRRAKADSRFNRNHALRAQAQPARDAETCGRRNRPLRSAGRVSEFERRAAWWRDRVDRGRGCLACGRELPWIRRAQIDHDGAEGELPAAHRRQKSDRARGLGSRRQDTVRVARGYFRREETPLGDRDCNLYDAVIFRRLKPVPLCAEVAQTSVCVGYPVSTIRPSTEPRFSSSKTSCTSSSGRVSTRQRIGNFSTSANSSFKSSRVPTAEATMRASLETIETAETLNGSFA